MTFKDGEEVQLKSGGPVMTVDHSEMWNGKERVQCVWFVRDEKKEDYFSPGSLKRYNGD